jgi:hypothetical protein
LAPLNLDRHTGHRSDHRIGKRKRAALRQGCPLATDNAQDFPMSQLQLYELPD